MDAGGAALELRAADIDPAPEPTKSPADRADTSAVASGNGAGAASHAALVSPSDGVDLAAPPQDHDGDSSAYRESASTAAELDREQSGWFGTRDSAGTDVLARDVVPAELLAPYEPLAAGAEHQPARAAEAAPPEAPLLAISAEERPVEAPGPALDARCEQHQPETAPLSEQVDTDAGASDGRVETDTEAVPRDAGRYQAGAEQVRSPSTTFAAALFHAPNPACIANSALDRSFSRKCMLCFATGTQQADSSRLSETASCCGHQPPTRQPVSGAGADRQSS